MYGIVRFASRGRPHPSSSDTLAAARILFTALDSELTQVVVEVLAGQPRPERPGHPAEYRMLRPHTLVGSRSELLEQGIECDDITLPLARVRRKCLWRPFEAVRP